MQSCSLILRTETLWVFEVVSETPTAWRTVKYLVYLWRGRDAWYAISKQDQGLFISSDAKFVKKGWSMISLSSLYHQHSLWCHCIIGQCPLLHLLDEQHDWEVGEVPQRMRQISLSLKKQPRPLSCLYRLYCFELLVGGLANYHLTGNTCWL